jgi:hypothetical protein
MSVKGAHDEIETIPRLNRMLSGNWPKCGRVGFLMAISAPAKRQTSCCFAIKKVLGCTRFNTRQGWAAMFQERGRVGKNICQRGNLITRDIYKSITSLNIYSIRYFIWEKTAGGGERLAGNGYKA